MEDDGEVYDLRYAKRAMMVLVTLPLLVMYTEAVLIPSLPTIQRQFHVTPSEVSWVLSIYLLTGTISVALFGKLGDIHGKRKLFLIALTIYTIGVTFTGFAPTFPILLLARALQGLGMAIFPLGFTIVREEFPPRMVPQVQGIISAMFGVGIAIALPLGSFIAENYGWEWTYHSIIPFAIIVLYASYKVLRESRYRSRGKMDWTGLTLLSIFSIAALIAVTRAPTIGWLNPWTIGLLTLSSISIIAFIFYERVVKSPLLPVKLLSDRNVLITDVGIFLAGFAVQMMNQAIIYILQMPHPYGYGKNILQSGLLMTPNAVVMLIVAPIVGKLMVKYGAKPFVYIGAILAILGLATLSIDPVRLGLLKLITLVVIVGTSISVLNVSLINVLIFSVDKRFLGVTTGLNSLFRNLGASWGPAVAGTLMTMYSITMSFPTLSGLVRIRIPEETAYRYLFLFSGGLYVLLLLMVPLIREVVRIRED
ncbi:MAG: MFS transporter [Desulfurococcales archaeon]|nr:MFS transporter [Desulfurococcales archaeon]